MYLLKVFWEVAGLLNRELNSVPVLYGSLGLSQHIDEPIMPSDIDLLVESEIFEEHRNRFPVILSEIGFDLIDESEQEYERDSIRIGIGSAGDLRGFAGIDLHRLQMKMSPCRYRVLSLNDYLAAYEASSRDGYRKAMRKKNDSEKIAIIKRKLGV